MNRMIILAAGDGTRMGDCALGLPKVLLKLGRKTLLDFHVEQALALGVTHLDLVVGYQAKKIAVAMQELAPNLTYRLISNPEFATTNTGYSLWLAVQDESRATFVVDGDLVYSKPLAERLLTQAPRSALLVDADQKLDEEAVKVIWNEAGILRIGKEISVTSKMGEFIGLSMLNDEWALRYGATQLSAQEKASAYYEDIFQNLIGLDLNLSVVTTDQNDWVEIDTPEDYNRAKRIFGADSK